MFPYLTGRVHAQTAPAVAYDAEGTVAHAKKLLALFEAHGIDKWVPVSRRPPRGALTARS